VTALIGQFGPPLQFIYERLTNYKKSAYLTLNVSGCSANLADCVYPQTEQYHTDS
jgi:hypothetical protein